MGALRLYVQTVLDVVTPNNPACNALVSLIELSEIIVSTARMPVEPAMLLGRVHKSLETLKTAFGVEWLTPKCHWLLHLPECLDIHGRLLY